MSGKKPLWIHEAEAAGLLDLAGAIDALEAGLRSQAAGQAATMGKTHASWAGGSTLHAIGAVFEADGVVGAKTWAHTAGGATPFLILWDAESGSLLSIIEAFALGQLRTAAVSAVATRWMAAANAKILAMIGTGKQALAQLAAVANVRPIEEVRIWGRDAGRKNAFAERADELGYGFKIVTPATVADAVDGAAIITTVTRAREPLLHAAMIAPGTHINAVGAITSERQELAHDVVARASILVADDPAAARRLASELIQFIGNDGDWSRLAPLSALVAGEIVMPVSRDLSIFKSMGMGVSDLALGIAIYRQAQANGLGREIEQPVRAKPNLGKRTN